MQVLTKKLSSSSAYCLSLAREVVAKIKEDQNKKVHAELETLAQLSVLSFSNKWKDWVRISIVQFFEHHLGFNFRSSVCVCKNTLLFFLGLYSVVISTDSAGVSTQMMRGNSTSCLDSSFNNLLGKRSSTTS